MTVFTDIMTTLIAAVGSMTTGGGFNYNYTNVDEYKVQNRTYPNVQIIYPEELARDVIVNMIDSYSTDVDIMFRTMVDDSVANVDEALNKVQEDLKRLLEQQHATLQTKGMITGDYLDSIREYTNIRKRPGIITPKFNIYYRIRRSDPSIQI